MAFKDSFAMSCNLGSHSPVVFVWERFGPEHVDRCLAVASIFQNKRRVIGIELLSTNEDSGWTSDREKGFEKLTLPNKSTSHMKRFFELLKLTFSMSGAQFFLSHPEFPEVFLTACVLRAVGRQVFVMGDPKFDVKQRLVYRELLRSVLYIPYLGAVTGGSRSHDYMKFLGFKPNRIVPGYATLSVARIRELADAEIDPRHACPFESRHFTVIARSMPNISTILDSYSNYARSYPNPRQLRLCGPESLEPELRKQVQAFGLENLVVFERLVSTEASVQALLGTLALLLLGTEEEFGLVAVEAQALGVPIVYSANFGARDELLRSGVNGFLVEPDNPKGVAHFLGKIASDEKLWRRLAHGALRAAPLGDSGRFADAVSHLTSICRV